MNSRDGDEKDEEGRAKDKNISLRLKSLEEDLTDNCFVQLEIAVYSWTGSVAKAPPVSWNSED
jgi:hypothetical protein